MSLGSAAATLISSDAFQRKENSALRIGLSWSSVDWGFSGGKPAGQDPAERGGFWRVGGHEAEELYLEVQ